MSDICPALEYLVACSNTGLESFLISRMNQAANLRREVMLLVDQWIETEVNASLSRWMLKCRRSHITGPKLRPNLLRRSKLFGGTLIALPSRPIVAPSVACGWQVAADLGEADGIAAFSFLANRVAGPEEWQDAVDDDHAPKRKKSCIRPFAQKYSVECGTTHALLGLPFSALIGPTPRLPRNAMRALELMYRSPEVRVTCFSLRSWPAVDFPFMRASSLLSSDPVNEFEFRDNDLFRIEQA